MSPWLVTWEADSERAYSGIPNRIAAILPNQTPERTVIMILRMLYANYCAVWDTSQGVVFSEQISAARPHYPIRPWPPTLGQEIRFGNDPHLFARHVYNLTFHSDKEEFQTMRWEQPRYPVSASEIVEGQPPPRALWEFCGRTNRITRLTQPLTCN
jgi:hypothetical protein